MFMWFFKKKRVPASDLFGQLSNIRNNIPPENIGDGVYKRARMMNDTMYSAKYYRKKLGEPNKYDLAEDKLEKITKNIIYQIYNYPFKVIPAIHKEKELQLAFERVYTLLSQLVDNKEPFLLEEKEIIPYVKFLDYGYADDLLSKIKDDISYLEDEEEMKVLIKAIEMDDYILSKVKSALNRIRTLNNPNESHIEERKDFYGYKKS